MSPIGQRLSPGRNIIFSMKSVSVLLFGLLMCAGALIAVNAGPAHSSSIAPCRLVSPAVLEAMAHVADEVNGIKTESARWDVLLTSVTRSLDTMNSRGHINAADYTDLAASLGTLRQHYTYNHVLVQAISDGYGAVNSSYERLQDITVPDPDLTAFTDQFNTLGDLVNAYHVNPQGFPAWDVAHTDVQNWYNNELVPACAKTGYTPPPLLG